MKKTSRVLSMLLVLVMVLTLNIAVYAESGTSEQTHINVAGKTTVTVDGVTYRVVSALSAITESGNYILSGNVAVAKNVTVTIPAGTVLHGNGYTISVSENSSDAPISKAPFVLGAGSEIKIINVNFGAIASPIVFEAVAPATFNGIADDLSLFIEGGEGVEAIFENVTFNVRAYDELVNVNTAAVVAVANGSYTFEGCVANINFDTGNMNETDGDLLIAGYTGGFIASAPAGSSVSFDQCTANGSIEADWRTGGFVGGLDGAASFTNSINNAKITNLTLVTGGFVGSIGLYTLIDETTGLNVTNNNLSAWTMDNCTNNGEITAYVGPQKASGGSHGDALRSAGAMVGYIYRNQTGTNPQWVVSNCINTGNIYGEDRLAGMVGDNRLTHQYDASGTLFQTPADPLVRPGYNPQPAITVNCINYGDVVCIVRDMASGAHVLGGMFSRTYGPNVLKNCVNYGMVDANGLKDGHLGGMVGNTSAGYATCYNTNSVLLFEDCVNYGTIINGRRLGGMVGCSDCPATYTNCANYGDIVSGLGSEVHAGSLNDNGLLAGGICGLAYYGVHNLINCVNYGSIEATHIAGGIASCTRNTSYTYNPVAGTEIVYPMELNIVDCANFGSVSAEDVEAGGIVGRSRCNVSVKNTVNTGLVVANNTFVASQIVCNAELSIAIENCYLFGVAAAETNADGILGFNCDMGDSIVCPEDSVMAYVIADEVEDERNVAVSAEEALEMVEELYPDLEFRLGGEDETPIVLVGYGSDDDHGHVWDEGTVRREPTCTTEGFCTYKCTEAGCYQIKTEIIPRLGHTASDWIIEEEPTCYSYGYKKSVCTRCGDEARKEIPMLDHVHDSHRQYNSESHESSCYCGNAKLFEHNWDKGIVTARPSCRADGAIIYTCTDCGQIKVEKLAGSGHDHLLPMVQNKIDATCTKDGSYESVIFCPECNTEISRTTVTIPSQGHSWDNGVITQNPTYVNDGVKTYTCKCGETRTESIPKLVPDSETPRIVVDSKTAPTGGTVKVTVNLADNPGVTAMYLTLLFDTNVMELISVEDAGLLNDSAFGSNLTSPYIFSWDDSLAGSSNTANGKLVTFTFKVKENAKIGPSAISITYGKGDVIDFDLKPVEFAVVDGIINVIEYVPGDVNLDGDVNAIDVAILRRHLASWPDYAEICPEVADVDKNGEINAIDVALIRRYLVKWEGVVLQ